jgi:hypothetical protein
MTEKVHVAPEQFVSYLYDECEPAERARIAAHLGGCGACAAEMAALGATRQHLAEWAPPDIALGFQITRPLDSARGTPVDTPAEARVLTSAKWWNRPMPAWAQAAAAAVIFASGLAVGMSRSGDVTPESDRATTATLQPAAAFTAAPADVSVDGSVSVNGLAREVERLRAEMTTLKSGATTVRTTAPSNAAVLARVQELIDNSKSEVLTDMTARDAQIVRTFELLRQNDRADVSKSINLVNGQAGEAWRQLRQGQEGLAKAVGLSLQPDR